MLTCHSTLPLQNTEMKQSSEHYPINEVLSLFPARHEIKLFNEANIYVKIWGTQNRMTFCLENVINKWPCFAWLIAHTIYESSIKLWNGCSPQKLILVLINKCGNIYLSCLGKQSCRRRNSCRLPTLKHICVNKLIRWTWHKSGAHAQFLEIDETDCCDAYININSFCSVCASGLAARQWTWNGKSVLADHKYMKRL